MKLNDLSESRKMLKLLKENRNEPLRPPRSYSEFSKSPKEKKHSFEKSSNITQNDIQSSMQISSSYLYCWGLSNQAQIQTYKPTTSRQQCDIITHQTGGIVSCAAGEEHTFYINNRNEVYGCGNNKFGQLGVDGVPSFFKPTMIPSLKDLKVGVMSCGAEHTFIITTKGELYSWGLNIKGQLGLGMYDNISSPCLVYSLLPSGYSNAKATQQGHKRLKSTHDPTNQDLSPGLKERSNSIDNIMEKIILMKEKIKRNNGKKIDSNEPITQILLQSDEVVVQVACGALHTLVLTNKKRLLSCGYGEGFALGHEDNQTLPEFKPIKAFKERSQSKQSPRLERNENIECGLAHSGYLVDNRLFVWGMLGQRETLTYRQPTQIQLNQEGLQHHNNETIIDFKMGECFTVLLSGRGEVYTFGENIDGQLGIEGIIYSDTPQKVQGVPFVGQINTGRNYCIALSADLRYLYGWGANSYGQVTGDSKGSSSIPTPKLVFSLPCEGQKIYCGSFQSILLAPQPFELQTLPDEFQEFIQDDVSLRKSTQNFQQNQQLKEDVERLQEELEKSKQEQETLKKFNIQLVQKTDKMKSEILINSKKKVDTQGFRKQVDQKTQTDQTFMEQKKGSSSNIKKQSSKFDITALEVSPERPIKHRIFQTGLDIDFSEVQLEKQISEGGYGIIYKAKWREAVVAVKMFKIEGMNETHIRDFLSECHAMEALRHPNIVMFLGACTKPPNLAIVLEYCTKGSLWSVLQNQDFLLTWDDRKRIALDAAKGVWYLHCFNPPILHRDLKSLNLLLDDALRTKLADFGWTRTLSNYMTGKIGTYQWMAPEVIAGQNYTEKADVFSFGIILWEIAAREPPYKNINGLQVSIEVLNNDYRPTLPKKTPEAFARLTKKCWDRDPEKRPNFKEIIKELEMMKFAPGM